MDLSCINCGVSRHYAPEIFGNTGSYAFVKKQPQNEKENFAAQQALRACPMASIGMREKQNLRWEKPETPETGAKHMGKFKAWMSGLGDAVVNPGAPLGQSKTVSASGYGNPDYWKEGGFSQFQEPADWENQLRYPNRPVVGVSWFEAQAFCAWASGRLPSEAEWERAARGNDGHKYPWGKEDSDESRLNFDRKVGHVTPVGLYPLGSSPEGLRDMAGNIWEWCHDWYDDNYYEIRPDANPPGSDKGETRVLRGGSWIGETRIARCAYRSGDYPDLRIDFVGFRMVL